MDIEIIEGEADNKELQIGIVTTSWNAFITDKLLQGSLEVLQNKGWQKDQMTVVRCPGAFEIPFTCRLLLPRMDGIIAMGAVIRGETPHFDYICKAAAEGILELNMTQNKPVSFGVLTTDTVEQALQRTDQNSKFGNKGADAALALLKMLYVVKQMSSDEAPGNEELPHF
jgi:6,7-dimethyl-8-ribityllumazine synthase